MRRRFMMNIMLVAIIKIILNIGKKDLSCFFVFATTAFYKLIYLVKNPKKVYELLTEYPITQKNNDF